MMTMIEWVFFDVGSVLFQDEQQACRYFQIAHEHLAADDPRWTFERLLRERENRIRSGQTFVIHKILAEVFGDDRRDEIVSETKRHLATEYDQNHLLYADVEDTLKILSERYRLGIIANQPPEARESIARRGLDRFFDHQFISDELNLFKPDPAFYRHAIEAVGCSAETAVMIGDRIDNDVQPAMSIGMRAILFNVPPEHAPWQPKTDFEHAFRNSIRAAPLFDVASGVAMEPDARVTAMQQIPQAISEFDG